MNNQQFKYWCQRYSGGINSQDPTKTLIMGIINVTPDSFSDGGEYERVDKALIRAQQLLSEGADLLDIGGESSRPGASLVSLEEELERVIPLITAIRTFSDVCISIDTSKAEVMTAAVKAGAGLINDINALRGKNSLKAAVEGNVPVCLMHMQGEPATMQQNPDYKNDLVEEIDIFFQDRLNACATAGIKQEHLILDPGFGFGKTTPHNLTLIKHLTRFAHYQRPLLLGVSRKSMIGALLNKPVSERLIGGLTLSIKAVLNGASIIRTHDVSAMKQALIMLEAVQAAD